MPEYNLTLQDIQARLLNLVELSRLSTFNNDDPLKRLADIKPPMGDIDIKKVKNRLTKQICSMIILSWHLNIDVGRAIDEYLNSFEQEHYMAT